MLGELLKRSYNNMRLVLICCLVAVNAIAPSGGCCGGYSEDERERILAASPIDAVSKVDDNGTGFYEHWMIQTNCTYYKTIIEMDQNVVISVGADACLDGYFFVEKFSNETGWSAIADLMCPGKFEGYVYEEHRNVTDDGTGNFEFAVLKPFAPYFEYNTTVELNQFAVTGVVVSGTMNSSLLFGANLKDDDGWKFTGHGILGQVHPHIVASLLGSG